MYIDLLGKKHGFGYGNRLSKFIHHDIWDPVKVEGNVKTYFFHVPLWHTSNDLEKVVQSFVNSPEVYHK